MLIPQLQGPFPLVVLLIRGAYLIVGLLQVTWNLDKPGTGGSWQLWTAHWGLGIPHLGTPSLVWVDGGCARVSRILIYSLDLQVHIFIEVEIPCIHRIHGLIGLQMATVSFGRVLPAAGGRPTDTDPA